MDNKNKTINYILIAVIIFVALFFINNFGETKIITTSADQRNAISVSGNAELEVEPDQAEIYVRIETFNAKADLAKNENAEISEKVTKALKKEGVKEADMETTSFYLNPKYRYDRNSGESILEGYTASNVIKVTTKDVDETGSLVDVAVDSGANSIQNVNFGLSKEKQKEVSGQALLRASEVARDKALSLASNLKISLGKVISVQESNFNYRTYDYAPMMEMEEANIKSMASTQITPGKVSVSASVSMSYEIR